MLYESGVNVVATMTTKRAIEGTRDGSSGNGNGKGRKQRLKEGQERMRNA